MTTEWNMPRKPHKFNENKYKLIFSFMAWFLIAFIVKRKKTTTTKNKFICILKQMNIT